MNKIETPYCDAATVPDLQQTLPELEVAEALPVGFELKGYRLRHVMAHSFTNICYLADDLAEKRQVAIKECYPSAFVTRNAQGEVLQREEHMTGFSAGKQRFMKEAGFLMSLDLPAIVRVDSVINTNGSLYMVMPYDQGETLFQKLLKEGVLTQHALLKLIYPIFDALNLIHSKGCLHRDIKPSNLYLRETGQMLLLDFSAALFSNDLQTECIPMISPGYTPIEQYSSNPQEQGPWTDIYSMAATLYKAVMGYPPVEAIERGQKILKDLEDPYEPLIRIASEDYTLRFLSSIDHALCFRAEDRPQSIRAWQAELDGTATVWRGDKAVRMDLMSQAAHRYVNIDLDLSGQS